MWSKKLFHQKERTPTIGIEIVGAKVTYSRCEFENCQISYSTDGYDKFTTKMLSSTIVGETSFWIFKEHNDFSIDSKITFHIKCTLVGIENVIWSGKATILPLDVIDEVKDFEILSSPLEFEGHDDVLLNINEAIASLSLRIYIPPIETTIAKVQLVVWQGKALNSKYPCYAVVGLLGSNNISRQRHRSQTKTNPSNLIFDYFSELDIFNILHGDILIELWEEHTLSSNKLLGQVIIPLSWLLSPGVIDGNNMEICGWFELFPTTVINRYNRYGQYRPYIKGIPTTSGYGLIRAEKPIGLIKIEARLILEHIINKNIPNLPVFHTLYCARKIEPYNIDMSSVNLFYFIYMIFFIYNIQIYIL